MRTAPLFEMHFKVDAAPYRRHHIVEAMLESRHDHERATVGSAF